MYTFKFQPNSKVQTNGIGFLKVSTSPVIPFAEEVTQEITLGDGTVKVIHTGVYKDIDIDIECNFISETREQYLAYKTTIDRYFGDKQGILELSEDRSHYWKVKNVSISAGSRVLKRATDLTITFTCEPYRYFKEYSAPINAVTGDLIALNNSFEPSFPIYKIYNDSENANLISISNNGKQLLIKNPFKSKTSVSDEGGHEIKVSYIEVDTQWNYLKTVFEGDIFEYRTIDTSGSFADIRFKSGVNEVKVDIDIGSCRVEIQREYREL